MQQYAYNLDNTLFGNVSGHVAPGSMFIIIGLWWLYNVIRNTVLDSKNQDNNNRYTYSSAVWYEGPNLCKPCRLFQYLGVYIEPIVKITLALIGVLIEISGAHWKLFDSKSDDFEKESMNNFSHATMYAFFFLSGVTDVLLYKGIIRGHNLAKLGHVILGLAFFIEGFLFYFHLDGRSDLDSHAHSLIYSLSFLISIILLFEAHYASPLLSLARCFCIILQGTWFYQVAFMLHGPNPWSQKSKAAAMFVPIAFSWHCFVIILTMIILLILGQKFIRSRCSDAQYLSMENLLTENDRSCLSPDIESSDPRLV